jgi:hypothetical protein
MKKIITIFPYIIMGSISFIGYICLPDIVRMWRHGCTFMSVTGKNTVSSQSNEANLYVLDRIYQVWDRTEYTVNDLVCVEDQM